MVLLAVALVRLPLMAMGTRAALVLAGWRERVGGCLRRGERGGWVDGVPGGAARDSAVGIGLVVSWTRLLMMRGWRIPVRGLPVGVGMHMGTTWQWGERRVGRMTGGAVETAWHRRRQR